tara:strand:- start:2399 stop:3778 length:1380 start_codon:yes stop_codon:yes gene_type:complete
MEANMILDPLSNVDVVDGVDVLTSVLDPITSSTVSCRFNIESRGFLQKDARLLFNVSHNGSKGDCAFNNQSGALGAVQRVILRYGTQVIHDIDFSGYVVARRQCTKNLSRRLNRDKYRYGVNPDWKYDDEGQLEFNTTEYANSGQGNTPDGWRMAISQDSDKPTQVCVPLRELLPIFRNPLCSFPLYALKNEYQMNLEIFWADAEEYIVASADSGGTAQAPQALPTITIANPQLVLNYIYYPDEITALYDKQINSQTGYVVYYTDVIHNQSYIPASTTENKTTHRIQMSGQELHKISVSVRQEDSSVWFARGCSKDMPEKRMNIRINDTPVFSEDVVNQGWFNYLWGSADGRLFLKNGQYSTALVKTKSEPIAESGLGDDADVQGQLNWMVVDFRKDRKQPVSLGNGLQVGLNPVELSLSYKPDSDADPNSNNKSYTLHIHSDITRVLQIRNGNVEVSF